MASVEPKPDQGPPKEVIGLGGGTGNMSSRSLRKQTEDLPTTPSQKA